MAIGEIVGAILAALLKAIFGTDQIHETEVCNPIPEIDLDTGIDPVDRDRALLRDCGL